MGPQKTRTFTGKFAKYRLWDEDKNKFYFSGDTLVIQGKGTDKEKSLVVPFAIPIDYTVKENFAINITEFTGILDSTPELRPIYTGDIVALTNALGAPAGRGVAAWMVEVASFNVSIDLMRGLKMKIIGNVYENKDLLEEIEQEAKKPQLDLSGNIVGALRDTKRLVN